MTSVCRSRAHYTPRSPTYYTPASCILSPQPLPRVLELAASKAADFTALDHSGLALLPDALSYCASDYGISPAQVIYCTPASKSVSREVSRATASHATQACYLSLTAQVAANVAASNAAYGGDRPDRLSPAATRILYPNGDVDPWHGLSVLKPPTPELPVLMVAGASHHAWTHPSRSTDQPSVVAARATIRKQVAAWLAQDA